MIRNIVFSTSLIATCVLHAGEVTTKGQDLTINLAGPIEVKSADGDYAIKLGGRLQWDYNYAELNDEADEDDLSVRRARIYMSGTMQDWSYKMQFNIGNNNGGTYEDLYIKYKGWGKKAVVTVGNQNEPFGLERLESSKDISYLERSAITEAYTPGRQEGIMLSGQRDNMTYAVGVFENDGESDGAAVTGRVTYAPIMASDHVLHLGLAHSQRNDDVDVTGAEIAYANGPYHFQSEWMSQGGATDSDGLYIQAGWIITGESRPYKNGVFKRVKPGGKSGAWEVVARYEDGDGNYSDEELGTTDATSYGIGINYYFNKYIRVGTTYTKAKDNNSDDDGSEFRARIQVAL